MRFNSPDEHGHISSLTTAINVKLVKNQIFEGNRRFCNHGYQIVPGRMDSPAGEIAKFGGESEEFIEKSIQKIAMALLATVREKAAENPKVRKR